MSSTANKVGLNDRQFGFDMVKGDVGALTPKVRNFIEESVLLCQPKAIHLCDGSNSEYQMLIRLMMEQGTVAPLPKYENSWLARTNPADVARVESKTFICTSHRGEAIPTPKAGIQGKLGNWISEDDMEKAIDERFPGCMKGRTMFVVPFSMGPLGSPLSKIGIEITDSPYVVCSMKIMTRMGKEVMNLLQPNCDFVKCLHSVGTPANGIIENEWWPCDPERTIVLVGLK